MRNALKDTEIKDMLLHDRDDNMMTKVKWSTETNDIDNRFLREYNNMHKLKEDVQIETFCCIFKCIRVNWSSIIVTGIPRTIITMLI